MPIQGKSLTSNPVRLLLFYKTGIDFLLSISLILFSTLNRSFYPLRR